LFTQCANCETIFRLSAEVLRTAGGQVRCGNCGEVFNALSRLAEDASAFSVGESPLDMETLADQILGSAPPAKPETTTHAAPEENEDLEAADVEFARLQVLDVTSDDMLEFTLPPGELDRVFVEAKPKPLPLAKTPAVQSKVEPAATPSEAPPAQPTPMDVSEEVRREVLAGFEEARLPEIAARRKRDLPRAAWVATALLLTAALIAQITLSRRDLLAWSFGGAAPTTANLSAYQLRQWGVTGDPGARGTLRVRASILNATEQLQPYPLLRVTLANRFGSRIGTRDFEPAEYLGKPTARMLAPGERVDAMLDILDPGKDAEDFEIDVCLRSADQRISCAADAAMQRKQ